MNEDVNSESSAAAPKDAPKPKRTRAKRSAAAGETKKPAAKTRTVAKKAPKTGSGSRKTETAAKAAPKRKAPAKRKSAAKNEVVEAPPIAATPFEDPIGDVSDGEAWTYTGEGFESKGESEAEAYRAEVAADAADGTLEPVEPGREAKSGKGPEAKPAKIAEEAAKDHGPEAEAQPPAKLERLQKILSQAGVASRRRAEEMIVAGRVMVNGQVVTALGSKADPERDHIRVDGRLLHGAERRRYFVLNKPKGYVTTVTDPEGRPTVMDFVRKLGERVYPVGRLDYQSEGLLLLTNDGELAHQLTRAAAGVEKTYLVKVAGQPAEADLEKLRSGVMIERAKSGEAGRVRTASARIRQIRPGENPWYEVVLIEGRNRELRKMFGAVGRYVEKIRRVGYGPLALDVEIGNLRELTPNEVEALRLTAEGKLKPRRIRSEAMLPKEAGQRAESQPAKPYGKRGPKRGFRGRGKEPFGADDFRWRGEGRSESKERPRREFRGERPAWGRAEEQQRSFKRQPEEPRGEPVGRDFRNRPGKSWDRSAGARPIRPEGRAFGAGPGRNWQQGAGHRPPRGDSGGPPVRGRGRYDQNRGSSGAKPDFRGRPGRSSGERGESAVEIRAQRPFGPGPGGPKKPGFKGPGFKGFGHQGKPGGPRRFGPRTGPRSGGKRRG